MIMKNNDAEWVVILDDAEFSVMTDSYSLDVLNRWRSVAWDVQAINANGRLYSLPISAQTSVEARNVFVARMGKERGLANNWTHMRVRRV